MKPLLLLVALVLAGCSPSKAESNKTFWIRIDDPTGLVDEQVDHCSGKDGLIRYKGEILAFGAKVTATTSAPATCWVFETD